MCQKHLGGGLSGPGFCGDLVCRFMRLGGIDGFSFRFGGGGGHGTLRACGLWLGCCATVCVLGFWPNRGWWLCCLLWLRAGGSGVGLCGGPGIGLFILVGWGRGFLSVAWPARVRLVFFFCSGVGGLFGARGSPSSGGLLGL